jgi:threonine/homoserine/homoserine lactone efflux protein
MTIEYFLAWLAVMFPLVFSPGPANVVFALSGVKQGVKKSIPLIAGVDLVFIIYSLIIGFGLGEVLKTYPQLLIIIKVLGIAYLMYMAYKFIAVNNQSTDDQSNKVYTFYDGVILQLLNPKGWTMLFLMFSLFLDGTFNETTQILYLVIMLAILNISTHIIWVAAGSAITKYISNPKIDQYLNYFFSGSLVIVALWLLIDTFK